MHTKAPRLMIDQSGSEKRMVCHSMSSFFLTQHPLTLSIAVETSRIARDAHLDSFHFETSTRRMQYLFLAPIALELQRRQLREATELGLHSHHRLYLQGREDLLLNVGHPSIPVVRTGRLEEPLPIVEADDLEAELPTFCGKRNEII